MRFIFLSPHLDDVALSCGGTLHRLRQAGAEVLVITVMAGKPDLSTLSDLARRLHKLMGNAEHLVDERRAEDAAAMKILGARRELLSCLDGPYRRSAAGGWRYPTISSLYASVHEDDREQLRELVDAIAACTNPTSDRYHAPLGIGGHVDHQIVNLAGHEMARRGAAVWFYEDYPYAEPGYSRSRANGAPATLGEVFAIPRHRHLVAQTQRLSETDIDARVASIYAYESQLDMLFGDRASVAPRLTTFALSRGVAELAERFWRPPSLTS